MIHNKCQLNSIEFNFISKGKRENTEGEKSIKEHDKALLTLKAN